MYIIYKVNCSSGNCDISMCNDSDEIKIEVDRICVRLGEARDYIHNFEYVVVDNKKCVISKIIDEKPTPKDDDGFYLVINNNVENRVDIYKKKTNLVEGYLYNSYEIKIEKIIFFEIKFFDKTVDENKVRTTCSNFTKEVRPNFNKKYILPSNVLDELKIKLRENNEKKENNKKKTS